MRRLREGRSWMGSEIWRAWMEMGMVLGGQTCVLWGMIDEDFDEESRVCVQTLILLLVLLWEKRNSLLCSVCL